ncbi:hypothetical protein NDU88_006245 [Pleurodeles waltl]|uniref:Uncharacterized protein n=1 Tax=Pleurodeles waltl TaxID=8319 RepID=A0AAV7WBY4_PLEWA|nr:hypothetical protein NDU88_006245 [Pleurodeles waltl]
MSSGRLFTNATTCMFVGRSAGRGCDRLLYTSMAIKFMDAPVSTNACVGEPLTTTVHFRGGGHFPLCRLHLSSARWGPLVAGAVWEWVFTVWQRLGCLIPFCSFFFFSGRARRRLPCCRRHRAWAARWGLQQPHSRKGARASSFRERCPACCTSLAVRGKDGTRPHLRTRGDGGSGCQMAVAYRPLSRRVSWSHTSPVSLGTAVQGRWGIFFSRRAVCERLLVLGRCGLSGVCVGGVTTIGGMIPHKMQELNAKVELNHIFQSYVPKKLSPPGSCFGCLGSV